ncbi:atp synthase subunit mitochondrial [Lasius niger]|uniref:Atp synthase subunit mitochondrial n=1 Tax=Lasius niger TaxID=67767 RepID=A0A0J7K5B0_LASNI|nr:atp synthase subunit mitochondrial [Lasius niger]
MARWVCDHGITHEAIGALLKILRDAELDQLRNLPLDPRTLLGTPKSTVIRSVPPGEYFHYGLKNALTDQLRIIGINRISNDIQINVNIDELPIAKSSKSQLYSILGEIYPKIAEPFVIGVYHGNEKPNSFQHGLLSHVQKVTMATLDVENVEKREIMTIIACYF